MHGATDYTVGATLMTVFPSVIGVEGTRTATQIRAAGAIHTGYSMLTDYPLGAVKVIPYKAHLAIDAIGAVALAATPFITGQYKDGRDQWLPHVALALFELSSLLMSDPSGRGDYHGNVDAVRAANAENPRRKINERRLAVVRNQQAEPQAAV